MTSINHQIKQINRERGFSLVEFLIAMTIGIFLLLGIISSYVSSKQTSLKNTQLSTLEDNGRFALETIRESLEHTGYTPINAGVLTSQFISAPTDVVSDTCPVGAIQNVVNRTIIKVTNDNAAGDSLGVIFHGDNQVYTDCSGRDLPIGCRLKPLPSSNIFPQSSRIYNSFYVDSGSNTLRCAGSRSNTSEVIADGVENIQFLYGVDTGNDGQVDRYVNATGAAGLWNNVVSIQVAILVRSLKAVKRKAEAKTYTLLDTVVTSPNDKFQRAVFSTSIRLRNTL